MMVLVFSRQNPIRLVRAWERQVLQEDRASAHEMTSLRPGDRGRRFWPGPVSVADVALVLFVSVASLFGFVERASVVFETDDGPLHYREPDLLGAALTLLGCAALLWRRQFPGWVLAVAALSAVARNAAGYPLAPMPYAVVVAAFAVGQRWPLPRSAVALLSVLAGMSGSALVRFGTAVDDEVLTEVLAVVAAWALGRGYRLHRVRTRLLEDRTHLLEQQARHLAHERSTVAALAAAHERASIARELHDIVANDVGMIVARAGGARRRQGLGADAAVEVLTSIESLGREALTDMRRLVGVLRAIDDDAAAAAPPGLDQLEQLVAKVAGAGTDVRLEVTGDRRPLPPAVELNAYRIVQESLTNAMKHAAGARVSVRVDFGPHRLRLVVRDHGGRETSVGAPGSGLLGMRQRVDLLGGSLSTGPVAAGGFVVDCVLPGIAGEVRRATASAGR